MTASDTGIKRFVALDAFRGLAIAGMILVNTPGSWEFVHAPLRHAEWHGCTPTDLVFPFFLFIMGASMAYTFRDRSLAALRHALPRLTRRVLLLFAIGLFLNGFGYWPDFSDWRIMGVLQRLALAYGLAALVVLTCNRTQRLLVMAAVLGGYWALLVLFGGAEPYALESNLPRRVDLAVLGASHMWQIGGVPFDPEGLLSTLPAAVSALLGYEISQLLRREQPGRSAGIVAITGVLLIVAGLVLSPWLPINKALWTPSYAIYTTGICALVLALFAYIADVAGRASLLKPLSIYGENPLFLYVISWIGAVLLGLWPVAGAGGESISAYHALFLWFGKFLSPLNASLAFALLQVLIYFVVAWVLHRRRIFIRL